MNDYWVLIDELRKTPNEDFEYVFKNFFNRIVAENTLKIQLLEEKIKRQEEVFYDLQSEAITEIEPILEQLGKILKEYMAEHERDKQYWQREMDNYYDYKNKKIIFIGEPLPIQLYHAIRYSIEYGSNYVLKDSFRNEYIDILSCRDNFYYVDIDKFKSRYQGYAKFYDYNDLFTKNYKKSPEWCYKDLLSLSKDFTLLETINTDDYFRNTTIRLMQIFINFIVSDCDFSSNKELCTNPHPVVASQRESSKVDRCGVTLFPDNGELLFNNKKYYLGVSNQVKFLGLLLKNEKVVSHEEIYKELQLRPNQTETEIFRNPGDYGEYTKTLKRDLKDTLKANGMNDYDITKLDKLITSIKGTGYFLTQTHKEI
jgi:hypothetical protein